MSSVLCKPFGQTDTGLSWMGEAERITFQVIVVVKEIQEFADFLEECKEMNIHVVAFLPPYASKVYDRFKEDSDKYPHIFDLYDYLKPICQAQGMSFFDYSDIRSLGANDFETIDGFHGSEVCYLKLLKQLAINDKILSPYVKESSLDSFMANTFSARQIVKEIAEADPRIPN